MAVMGDEKYRVVEGNCLEVMMGMDENSIHCVVTSPPYFGLRDYGVEGQLGLEQTPEEYVAKMVDVFRGVRRVLRGDGTVWLNLGDSYASGTKGSGGTGKSTLGPNRDLQNIDFQKMTPRKFNAGFADKQLIGIPWRVAFALQADGWWLRSEIIWHKPNPMPESVTDRPTKSHEQIFLLTKSARYFYDAEAVKEATSEKTIWTYPKTNGKAVHGYAGVNSKSSTIRTEPEDGKRNRRSVWTVATQPFTGAHFAVFPPKLIEPCVLAGCPEKCCPVCGAGWERVVERTPDNSGYKNGPGGYKRYQNVVNGGFGSSTLSTVARYSTTTLCHQPTCQCNATNHINGTVLDPFSGAGTTGIVAMQHNRRYIGIELNPEYVGMSERRLADVAGRPRQLDLF